MFFMQLYISNLQAIKKGDIVHAMGLVGTLVGASALLSSVSVNLIYM